MVCRGSSSFNASQAQSNAAGEYAQVCVGGWRSEEGHAQLGALPFSH